MENTPDRLIARLPMIAASIFLLVVVLIFKPDTEDAIYQFGKLVLTILGILLVTTIIAIAVYRILVSGSMDSWLSRFFTGYTGDGIAWKYIRYGLGVLLGWLVFLLILNRVFPEEWVTYRENTGFFWMSHLAVAAVIILTFVLLRVYMVALAILIALMMYWGAVREGWIESKNGSQASEVSARSSHPACFSQPGAPGIMQYRHLPTKNCQPGEFAIFSDSKIILNYGDWIGKENRPRVGILEMDSSNGGKTFIATYGWLQNGYEFRASGKLQRISSSILDGYLEADPRGPDSGRLYHARLYLPSTS